MQRRLCGTWTCKLLVAGLLAGVASCDRSQQPATSQAAGPAPSGGKPVLAASVFPLADLVGRVAGDRWEVVCLLPPGRNPHGYALRPVEAESLVRARVLFAAGVGLDGWAIRAAGGINSHCKVIVLTEALGVAGAGRTGEEEKRRSGVATGTGDEGIGTRDGGRGSDGGTRGEGRAAEHEGVKAPATGVAEDEDHDEHEHAGGMDPHIWLDPQLATGIAGIAAAELTRLDPAGREVYQVNLERLRTELNALDADYRTGLASCHTRELVVFHPGYGFLAGRYGLHQVPIVAGMEAKAAQVQEVIDLVKRDHIRAIYREPQFESRWVDFISRATGAKVLVLDPQGHAGKAGYDSYFAMMRSNLAALKEGLACGS